MTAPTIEAVAAWLRNCSIEEQRGAAPLHNLGAALATPDSEKQQKTRELWSSFYSSEEYTSGEETNDEESTSACTTGDEGEHEHDGFYGHSHGCSTNSSTGVLPSISDASGAGGGTGGFILVVAGCQSCFMYFMVPKCVEACPRCGVRLLHIGGSKI